jgi:hypothetical protein
VLILTVLAATRHDNQSLGLFLCKSFYRELLAGVIPRLAQAGFTLAQPYIIRRAVILLATPESANSQSRGIALVAAFAIVYVGLAVRLSFSYDGQLLTPRPDLHCPSSAQVLSAARHVP